MSTSTTRAGLVKPSGSASPAEYVDVTVLNSNADKIDKLLGCILVNDGVTPPNGDLIDGAIVREKTSGIIWEARANGGGGFDKIYIRYPYLFIANGTQSVGTGTTMSGTTLSSYVSGSGQSKNSSSAHLVTNTWKCPVKGIYRVVLHLQWATNATGRRTLGFWLNGADGGISHEQTIAGSVSSTSGLHQRYSFDYLFNVNDTAAPGAWQDSGGNLALDQIYIRVAMIEPVQ